MASQMSVEQRSSKESLEEFGAQLSLTLSRLEETDAIFFHKRMAKSMVTELVQGPFAYSLEFPIGFVNQYGNKFGTDVTFELMDSGKTWPVTVTVKESLKKPKHRVFAYGVGGWKAFLMDNHIKVGDTIILTLVKFSYFCVDILRARAMIVESDHENGNSNDSAHVDSNDNGNSSEMAHTDSNETVHADFDRDAALENDNQRALLCTLCDQATPYPRFLATIWRPPKPQHPANHLYLENNMSLPVPRSFWALNHHMLEGGELKLQGPNKIVTKVNVKRTYHEEVDKVSVRLESGWKAFLHINNLGVGDILRFSLVGKSSFIVDVVDRIEF